MKRRFPARKTTAFSLQRLAVLVLLAALPAVAESRARRVWKWSLAALAAGAAADVASSSGRYEANPLMRDASGRFSPGKGIAIKAGVCAGLYIVGRKSPTVGTVANFAVGATWGAVAAQNWGIQRKETRQ